MEADHAPPGGLQGLLVAQGLGHLEHAKTHRRLGLARLVRDIRILPVVGGELDEQAVAAIALVQLAGGVQEARPVAHRRRQAQAVAHPGAQRLQCRVDLGGGLHPGLYGDVIPTLGLA
ncbi:MAG: hypothetical protein GWN66_24975 [Pseudomonas stutzeri]|nr:hypothetical protein [Stutzerimonas stutzeri]